MACLDLFQVDEAYQQLEPAHVIAHELGSAIWTAGTAAMLAFVYLARGEIALAETLLAEHSATNDAPSMHERLLTIARTELALAQGRPGSALDLLDGLVAMAPGREPGQVIPRLWYLRGRAKAAAGHTDAAIADFQAACTASLRLGTRPLAWRIQGELARLYQAQGRHAEADAHRAAARALVETLAASVPEPAWRDHFQQQAFRLLDL
jgi:tetratricopeptide (TPR) repeat protein